MLQLTDDVSRSTEGVRSNSQWAKALNPIIKKGLRQITFNHLVKGVNNWDKAGMGLIWFGFPAVIDPSSTFDLDRLSTLPVSSFIFSVAYTTTMAKLEGRSYWYCNDILGLFAPQVCRALILGAYISSKTFVKALDSGLDQV
jgi:hypothetical protein